MKIKRRANKKDSKQAEYIFSMGNEYKRQSKIDEAIHCYQNVIKLNPTFAGAYHNLGNLLAEKGQVDKAMTCYKKAIELTPNIAVAYNNLANVLQEKGQVDDSIEYYEKALQIDPTYVLAYVNLGIALEKKGQINQSIEHYQKALQLDPHSAQAYAALGTSFLSQGKLNNAEASYRKALQIDPKNSSVHSNLLFSLNHNPQHSAQNIFHEHVEFGKHFAEPLLPEFSSETTKKQLNRKLRIGYVSPDFHQHSVAYFIEPIIAAHNREYFEVCCYSNSLMQDDITRKIREYSDNWRIIVGMSDEKANEQIRKDNIDILVDLAGHTANNRMLLFARKPAPIQANWIGYPATTGLSAMDYKIVDSYTDPPGMTEQYYTEKLIRLPESFLCYLPYKNAPEVHDLPSTKLNYVTFGSFNNFAKVTPEIIASWVKILRNVPNSHLIIKARSLSDRMTYQYAMEMFTQQGIAAERIELLPFQSSIEGHLSTYNRVDIGLDTFPYNGTTTTCEALWMGVPVVTLAGKTHSSRVGLSLLSNIGLQELIANTTEEYFEIAVNLAYDLKRLQSLHERLRDMMKRSPLCDAERFTANLEMCYRQIWEK